MPQRYMKCANCPTWFKTPFSTRKYCSTCQIIRDSEVRPHEYGDKATECTVCAQPFYPARPNWTVCAKCVDMVPQPHKHTACNACGEHWRKAPGLENTCGACVQANPTKRREYVRALKVRQARLIAENPPPPPEYVAWVEQNGGEARVSKPVQPKPDDNRVPIS